MSITSGIRVMLVGSWSQELTFDFFKDEWEKLLNIKCNDPTFDLGNGRRRHLTPKSL